MIAATLRSFAMAASSNSMSHHRVGPSQNLKSLISQLRLYKSPRFGGVGGNDDDEVDERGKIFSPIALAESSVPPAVKSHDNRAAVLVCLFKGDLGDLRVILTKRSSNLSSHSGEVALPGGKADECDVDDIATAMREAKEEIGLDPSLVNVVSVLEPFLSKKLLRVVPVIGVLSDRQAFRPVANASEVESIFDAPLEMFLKVWNKRKNRRIWKRAQIFKNAPLMTNQWNTHQMKEKKKSYFWKRSVKKKTKEHYGQILPHPKALMRTGEWRSESGWGPSISSIFSITRPMTSDTRSGV